MLTKKNTIPGKINFFILFSLIIFNFSSTLSNEKINLEGKYIELKILDKVSSKNTTLKLEVEKEIKFQNLSIKAMKCKNSEFDDNPEIIAYLQVRDLTTKDNDKVFVFNDWTFSSSPTLKPFDHPVYDIWLTKCYN